MTTVDTKVVEMKFDNKQFEAGIKTTLDSLSALNKGLALTNATKGLEGVSAAAKNVSLSHIGQSVDNIAEKFRTMSIVAITALATIVHTAVNTGLQLTKSLTIDPIKTGLQEYETNLNAIQTILANTQAAGTGLKEVNEALRILNEYSDQTIYNFSEMARNIGTFTAAGVGLEKATAAIKGIANLAALSGSNSLQASTAMYQLSQAISAGKVSLMDWNSVVNAGMGGTVFQRALANTAVVMGKLNKGAVTLSGAMKTVTIDGEAFRLSLEKGWLTSDVLTNTLAQFTGDLKDAELAALGFSKTQIAEIQKQAKTAQEAATKVKTLSQLMSVLAESAGSGWAQTWQIIFGDFEEARTLFTGINNVLGGFIKNSADARNELLEDWEKMGGRTALIEGIGNAFNALLSVLRPIRDAFRDMFPATTARDLVEFSVAFRNFTSGLALGSETAEKLRRTFAGVFAIFGIGWDLIKVATTTLLKLVGIATEGSGGFLEFTARIGDFLVELRKAIQEGQGFVKIFTVIGNVLTVPILALKILAGFLGGLFDDFDGAKAVKTLTGLTAKFEPLTKLGELIAHVWTKVISVLGLVAKDASNLGDKFAGLFGDFGKYISAALKDIDFSDVLKAINTGLFGGLLLMIQNIFGGGGKGIFGSIRSSFDQLTDTMQTMQNTLRAATLLQIALAIGVLTVSVNTLSKIDSAGLTRALTAITMMFGQLLGALLLFEKMSGFSGLVRMPIVAAGLILLGVAVRVLAGAAKELAELDWSELARGLTGVTVLLGALVGAVNLIPPAPGLIATGAALVILAGAVKLLASSVTDLSGLSWEEMAKGLVGVGAVLAGLTLFTKFATVEKGGLLAGAGIVLLAVGIKILASAMKDFADLSWAEIARGLVAMAGGLVLVGTAVSLIPPTAPISAAGVLIVAFALGMIADALKAMGGMSWGDIGKGLTTLAGALTLIGLAISLIPPTAPLSAAGIYIVALALGFLADALKQMGGMSWGEIAKALVTLAGALTIITLAMIFMTSALPGAAALVVVTGALLLLVPILQTLGQMSWGEITKGLLTLAGVFLVLGVAGALLTPVVPTLLGLGIAIALIGVGLLAAGVGILAFSVAVTALSISGAALVTTIIAIVAGLIGLIPTLAEQIGLGLVVVAGVIGNAGPALTEAVAKILIALLDAIIKITPKLGEAILKLLLEILNILEGGVPRIIEVGLKLLLAFLKGIRDNIREITVVAGDILVQFIKGMQDNQPKLLQAGADFIISYIENLAKTIRSNSDRLNAAGIDLASAIIEGMAKGLASGGNKVAQAAKDVAKKALDSALKFLGINSPSKVFEVEVGKQIPAGVAVGVTKYSKLVTQATEAMAKDSVSVLQRSLSDLSYLMDGDLDLQPTITPVLDLTNVRKSAVQIGAMLSAQPIKIDATYSKAKDASAGVQENEDISLDNQNASDGDKFTFNQYNSSPRALPVGEVYRQTKNQLSVAKEVTTP